MVKRLLLRLRLAFRGGTRHNVDEELRFHLEQQAAAYTACGMSPAEAHRQAAIAFGAVERTREACHEQHPGYWLETLTQDLRYAVRGLRRSPSFTLTVILTLMLGIGATTAVFSVVDRILFRPLPYGNADRLVSLGLIAPIEAQEFMLGGSYYEWRDNQKPFAAMTSETGVDPCDLTEDKPMRLTCASVEGSFLSTLGVSPVIGRSFTEDEDRPNGAKVALISYGLWRSRFQLDRGAVGRVIRLDGHSVQIIGVLPKDFEMPRLQPADLLVPQALDEAAQRKADPGRVMWAYARLKPGMSIEQAKEELQPLFDYSLRLAPPQFRKEVHLQVRSLRGLQIHDVRLVAWILSGLVITVLLIACANVTSLMMAREASRERELAVRSALGASRVRLVRQGLTESLVLSLGGAGAGCLLAEILLHFFIVMAPQGLPFLSAVRIDGRILIFTLLTALVCAGLSGFAPAFRRPRVQTLVGRAHPGATRALLRQWLVIIQIAASMVLLVGGALLARSFWILQTQGLGMQVQNIVTVSISLGQDLYATPQSRMAFYQKLVRSLRYGPGVTALAVSDSLPPGGYERDQIYASIAVDGRPALASGTGGTVAWRRVTPDYFRALDIPRLKGRGFTEDQQSSGEHVAVLSRTLAARMFPLQNPIGRRLRLAVGAPQAEDPWFTITGVVADVKNGGLAGGEKPEYYRLRRNVPDDWDRSASLILKTILPPAAMENWVRSQVAVLDPTLPVEIQMLSERVGELADQPRFETLLVGFFASTGLVLAVIGLYGVISFLVVQRTQEIGVRMALGATRNDILTLVIRSGLRLILPGVLFGLILAVGLSRALASLLFHIGAHDPVAFACVTFLLVLITMAATLLPARAATAVDPSMALRCD